MEINWANFGFSRASALVPRLALGKPVENADTLLTFFKSESDKGASVITTAELALTGYTCEDLFHSETLHQDAAIGLKKILDGSKGYHGIWIVGAPLRLIDGRLFNGAYVFSNGKVLGFVPKLFLPNMGEFYESLCMRPLCIPYLANCSHLLINFFIVALFASVSKFVKTSGHRFRHQARLRLKVQM
jgi:hypothetical protein